MLIPTKNRNVLLESLCTSIFRLNPNAHFEKKAAVIWGTLNYMSSILTVFQMETFISMIDTTGIKFESAVVYLHVVFVYYSNADYFMF